jgi:hypothetical protein
MRQGATALPPTLEGGAEHQHRSREIRPRNRTDFLPGRHLNDNLVDGRSGEQPAKQRGSDDETFGQ